MEINNLYLARMKYFTKVNEGSVAGNVVQKQIFDDLKLIDEKSFFLSFQPLSSWPKGPLLVGKISQKDGIFIPYINIYIIRDLIFFYYIFKYSLMAKNIFQYNSYFVQNISLCFSKLFLKKNIVCIFQDYKVGGLFSLRDRFFDKISSHFLRYFNCTIVVSEKLASEIRLKNFYVFPGALTYVSNENILNCNLKEHAVYAGALEKHNGVDILIKTWFEKEIEFPLDVYGKGSLYTEMKKYENKFITIHGFKDVKMVNQILSNAKINFCLRYSNGINEDFFFPSKFFNLCAYPGYLIVNEFKNLPLDLKDELIITDNSLGNLKDLIGGINEFSVDMRRENIKKYTWYNCLAIVSEKYLS